MADYERITPGQAKHEVVNNGAILVNGYDDPLKWDATRVVPAHSFMDFSAALSKLDKGQEVIFYCAWPNDATAVSRAEEFSKQGWKNVKVVAGGLEALKRSEPEWANGTQASGAE